jgi:hypothetical protein
LEDTAPQFLGRGANGVDRADDILNQLVDVERAAVGEISFGQGPDPFIGIEIRSVSRKVLNMETRVLPEKFLERRAVVGRGVVQQDDDVTPKMPQQLSEKQAHFLLADVVEVKEIVKAQALPLGTERDSGDHGDFVSSSLAVTLNGG